VRHNDANIICFSEDFSLKNIKKSVKKFLFAEFESGRHLKRVKKIKEIERGNKK